MPAYPIYASSAGAEAYPLLLEGPLNNNVTKKPRQLPRPFSFQIE
jgi:hypothetical protein